MRTIPASEAPAVVSSGAHGIGAAVVRSLAAAGHPVSFGYEQSAEAAAELESELAGAGLTASAFELDVLDSGSLDRFKELSTARFGSPLCVVSNSSVSVEAPAADVTRQEWDSVVATNLSGAFQLVQQFLGEMLTRGYGRVVLVGSAAALIGRPEQTAYCASSAALEGLVRALAVEVAAHDVLVNAVAPGLIDGEPGGLASEQVYKQFVASTALRRAGQASEVAEAVRFLCGSEPTAVTGTVLRVDGGLTA